jgi:hypothetical protein
MAMHLAPAACTTATLDAGGSINHRFAPTKSESQEGNRNKFKTIAQHRKW